MASHTNPFTAEMKACPYPVYDEWREQGPVIWSDEAHAWLVLGYEEADYVLRNHGLFSSKNSVFGGPELAHPEFPSIINLDEPEHRRMRALVAKAFTPRTLDSDWEPRIQEVVHGLLDDVERASTFRVVRDLAAPLPVIMIAEIIGVRSEDFRRFKEWSDTAAAFLGRVEDMEDLYDPALTDDERLLKRYARYDNALGDFFHAEMEQRRQHPSDDLMSRLIEAEVDGERLTGTQIIAFCTLLLVAGNETTTNAIVTAIRGLVEHPEQMRKVRERPDLMERLVEETLRWDAPIQGFYRRANEETALGGVSVRAGDALLVTYGAANHDPRKYDCPADFDVERGSRDHLAFGIGIHTCLGAGLARLETRTALGCVLDRFADLRAIEGYRQDWRDTPFFRGPVEYELQFSTKR